MTRLTTLRRLLPPGGNTRNKNKKNKNHQKEESETWWKRTENDNDDDDEEEQQQEEEEDENSSRSRSRSRSSDHDDEQECHPTWNWQTQTHLSCPALHEFNLPLLTQQGALQFLACGGDRCTFQMDIIRMGGSDDDDDDYHHHHDDSTTQQQQVSQLVALKMVKLQSHQFRPTMYDHARRDSLTMEQLTASPYILNLYASCGVAQVLELATGGSLHDLIYRTRWHKWYQEQQQQQQLQQQLQRKTNHRGKESTARHNNNNNNHHDGGDHQDFFWSPNNPHDPNFSLLTALDQLRIAVQVTTAVADLHDQDITHNDLCCHQFVWVNGVYKLNDFHLSYFIYQRQRRQIRRQIQQQQQRPQLRSNNNNNNNHNLDSHDQSNHDNNNNTKFEKCWYHRTIHERYLLAHAPEESYSYETVINNEKADVYVLGNVLYYILTNEWIFERRQQRRVHGPTPHAAATTTHRLLALLRQGVRPSCPTHICANSTNTTTTTTSTTMGTMHPAHYAIWNAISNQLWLDKVEERSSARQVANYLHRELQRLLLTTTTTTMTVTTTTTTMQGNGSQPPQQQPSPQLPHDPLWGVVRVSIPPLPPDWSFRQDPTFELNFDEEEDDEEGEEHEEEQ
ncbi:hypothetical protein ACA910_010076 [Epithemia clementina (nom. ined.)]